MILASGLLTVAALWTSRTNPFWSGYLGNAAVTLLLLIPGAWVLKRLDSVEARAETASKQAESAAMDAAAAKADTDSIAQAILGAENLEDALREQQLADLQERKQIFSRWADACDRDSTIAAMSAALNMQLISPNGYRTPLYGTYLHLHFKYEPDSNQLVIQVERDDGTILGDDLIWTPDEAALEIYARIEQLVDDAGAGIGAGHPVTIRSIQDGAKALEYAVGLRSRNWSGGSSVRNVIEFIGSFQELQEEQDSTSDGWYLMEDAMFPSRHPIYQVSAKRLGEKFWRQHLEDKPWGGGSYRALEVYRALKGVLDPEM